MRYYFAQFMRDSERPECYDVHFPDFPEVCTFGEGLEEAMAMAQDALELSIEARVACGDTVPEPSQLEEVRELARARNEELEIETRPDALYMLVPADPKPEPYARINISMRPSLVARIDRAAKELGLTRSGFLAQGAELLLGRKC